MTRVIVLALAAALSAAGHAGATQASAQAAPGTPEGADAAAPPLTPAPPTPKRPVFDDYHGVRVEDDYRWLESWADPEVRAWSAAQNQRSRAFLDALPGHAAVQARIAQLVKSTSVSYSDVQRDRVRHGEGPGAFPGALRLLTAAPRRRRTKYPAVLLITGENDPRVDPWHSRKFAARLQAATTSGLPVLLRTSSSSGHGIGSALDEIITEYSDEYAFLLYELGVPMTGSGPQRSKQTGP